MRHAAALLALLLAACVTDPATRLAGDLESAAGSVGHAEGSRHSLTHRVPSKHGECEGRYKVQADAVGALIIWCLDASGGRTVSSHSTSSHNKKVQSRRTFIVEKAAGEALVIELVRQGGRVVIADVR